MPVPWDRSVRTPGESAAKSWQRWELFRLYGNFTMAYATLQSQLKYFEADGAYLAYDTSLGISFVLGDPVGPFESHAEILAAFVRLHPRHCFCQVSKPTAEILARLGCRVNEFGADMETPFADVHLRRPRQEQISTGGPQD